MKIFRELTFEGRPENLLGFLDGVEALLSDGWSRDYAREHKRLTENYYIGTTKYDRVFYCSSPRQRVAIHLWIIAKSEQELYVSNLVPVKIDQLSYDEYNAIIEEFHNWFAARAASKQNVIARLGSDQWSPEENLPEQVSRSLREFSGNARRYSGLGHPADEERWQKFIIAAHDSNCDLNGTTLRRWLIEDEHWPEEFVGRMISEYETGRSLLARAHQATA